MSRLGGRLEIINLSPLIVCSPQKKKPNQPNDVTVLFTSWSLFHVYSHLQTKFSGYLEPFTQRNLTLSSSAALEMCLPTVSLMSQAVIVVERKKKESSMWSRKRNSFPTNLFSCWDFEFCSFTKVRNKILKNIREGWGIWVRV
jgi:hypothetical protein